MLIDLVDPLMLVSAVKPTVPWIRRFPGTQVSQPGRQTRTLLGRSRRSTT